MGRDPGECDISAAFLYFWNYGKSFINISVKVIAIL